MRLQTTYEELKLVSSFETEQGADSLQTTYEELKLEPWTPSYPGCMSLQTTYEELKLHHLVVEGGVDEDVYRLPMRN